MLQKDIITQNSMSFGFDCGMKVIPGKIFMHGTSDSVPP